MGASLRDQVGPVVVALGTRTHRGLREPRDRALPEEMACQPRLNRIPPVVEVVRGQWEPTTSMGRQLVRAAQERRPPSQEGPSRTAVAGVAVFTVQQVPPQQALLVSVVLAGVGTVAAS